MQLSFQHLLIACAAGILVLAGCSPSAGDQSPAPAVFQARDFSEADKLAARALSIGNMAGLPQVGSPYSRALLCTTAVGWMIQRLQDTAGLTGTQIKALHWVYDIYSHQANVLGGIQGKDESDIQGDIRKSHAENTDPSTNARVALACFRRLQEEQGSGP